MSECNVGHIPDSPRTNLHHEEASYAMSELVMEKGNPGTRQKLLLAMKDMKFVKWRNPEPGRSRSSP